jgi:hypothetical protein
MHVMSTLTQALRDSYNVALGRLQIGGIPLKRPTSKEPPSGEPCRQIPPAALDSFSRSLHCAPSGILWHVLAV